LKVILIPTTIIVIILLLFILFMAIGYVKAPPDMAFIISGFKKKSKIVIGKASIRIPFFERLDKLNLRLIPIDVKTSNAVPTADYININVDATVNIKISNDPDKLRLAAENFLNKDTAYIASVAREVLEGNVREIVGKMRLEEMVSDRQKFANLVKENAEPDSISSASMYRTSWTETMSSKTSVSTISSRSKRLRQLQGQRAKEISK